MGLVKLVLENGLRIIYLQIPGAHSASVGAGRCRFPPRNQK